MDGWTSKKLGTIADFTNGGSWSESEYTDEGIPVIRVSDIKDGQIDISRCKYLSTPAINKYKKNILNKGDLIICTVGSHPTQPKSVVGRAAVVPPHISGALLNQNAVRVAPRVDYVDKKWLGYLGRSQIFRNYIIRHARGAANQVRMSIGALKDMEIEVPPLDTQRQIASILSAYDDLIENNTRRIRILEEMAQSLYREWFVHFRFPGHEKVKLLNSPLGKIPEGWDIVKVANILLKCKRMAKIKKQDYIDDGPIPVVDQGREFVGGYTFDERTLVERTLPVIVFGDHTRVLKYIDFPFACGADGTQVLRSNTERMPMSLFYHVLSSIDLADFAYARHFKFLREEEVLLPDTNTAKSFSLFTDPVYDMISIQLRRNNDLRRTRDFLLPKLISGNIGVDNLIGRATVTKKGVQ